MELFSNELVLVLSLFGRGVMGSNQLREYLAERFLSNAPDKPLDRLLLGELEIALAEYERGDRDLVDIQKSAKSLSSSAILLAQQLGVAGAQEPALALV